MDNTNIVCYQYSLIIWRRKNKSQVLSAFIAPSQQYNGNPIIIGGIDYVPIAAWKIKPNTSPTKANNNE